MAVNSTDISKIRDLIENAIKSGADPKLLIPDATRLKALEPKNLQNNIPAANNQQITGSQQQQQPIPYQQDPLLEDFLNTDIAKNIGKKREYFLNRFIASKYEKEFAETEDSNKIQIEFNEAFTSFRKEQREDLKREVEELKKQLKELANSTNNSKEVVKTDNDSNS